MGLQMQQPPRGETWVGMTCNYRNLYLDYIMQVLPGEWLHISLMKCENKIKVCQCPFIILKEQLDIPA
ncbi:hypothetical protein V1478_003948 [Vespula squamosa]|uniref:Uncharacterized protein n=1 Tax=Vespula squamosa TaxID=30214 RepID=A0ABD2BNL1_VESSQ